MRGDEHTADRFIRSPRALIWVVSTTFALTGIVVAAGVGMVAVIGRSGDDDTWRRWSDVGQAFGAVSSVVAAFAVAALIITSAAQSRSQRDQQTEISVRQLHVTLTRMAIDDPQLAAVWPRTTMDRPATQAQYMYANLLLQHAWLQYTTGVATRPEMVQNLRFLFASPIVRAFWEETSNSRYSIYVEGATEATLAEVADQIWREYQAVLACSSKSDPASSSGPGLTTDETEPTALA